nr:MAG TPA: hypothetical protein [Bacteriophage sp.]DAH37784.1 MAG TPA: hypothetical protein [Caudoviricetes sp.]
MNLILLPSSFSIDVREENLVPLGSTLTVSPLLFLYSLDVW